MNDNLRPRRTASTSRGGRGLAPERPRAAAAGLPLPVQHPLLRTSFRWLLWSDALTLLSMMVGQVALPWWIAQSGGAHDLSVYGVLVSAMSFVALPLLSPFADRHSKRSLMTVGLLGFGIATSAMAAYATLAHYRLAVGVAVEALTVLA